MVSEEDLILRLIEKSYRNGYKKGKDEQIERNALILSDLRSEIHSLNNEIEDLKSEVKNGN